MSVDPVSVGIKIGAMALSTAMSASQVIEGPRLKDLNVSISEFGTPLLDVYGTAKLDGLPYIHAEKLREKKVQSKTKGGKYNEYKYFFTGAAAVAGHELDSISKIWFDGKLVFDLTKAGPPSIILGLFFGLGNNAPVKLTQGRNFRMYLGTETQMPDPRYEEWCEDKYGPDSANAWRGTPYLFFEEIPLEKLGNRPPTISALAVRNKTNAYLSETIDAQGAPRFGMGYSRFDLDGYLWDTATLEKITASPGVHAWGSTGWIWDMEGNFPVGPSIVTYGPDGQGGTIIGPSPAGADALIMIHDEMAQGNDIVILRPFGGVIPTLLRVEGLAINEYPLDFSPTIGLRDGDGNPFILGRKFGGDTGIFVQDANAITNVLTVSDSIATSSNETVTGWLNTENEWVLVQGDEVHRVDPETLAILQTEDYGLGVVDLSQGSPGWSFWGVSGSTATEYSMIDLSVLRTVDLLNWGVGTGGIYDPINHAIVQTTAGDTRWLYLDRVSSDGMNLSDVLDIECGLVNVTDFTFTGTDPVIDGWAVAPGVVSDRIAPLLDMYDVDLRAHDFGLNALVRGGAPGTTISSADFVRDGEVRWQSTQVQDVQLPMRLTFTYMDSSKDYQINSSVFQRPGSVTDSSRDKQIDMSTFADTPAGSQPKVDRFGRRQWFEREPIEFNLTMSKAGQMECGDLHPIILDGEPRIGRLIEITRAGMLFKTKWVRDDPRVHDPNAAVGPSMDGRDDEELYISGPTKGFVLDIPYLRDAESTSNVLLHYGAGAYGGDWPGATIYQLDPVENEYTGWEDVESGSRAVWGYATEALPGFTPSLWDHRSSLNVRLRGELVSRTQDEIDADPTINLAYVGDEEGNGELINFADATLEADDTWTISTLKRGRRGTEWAIESHAQGDLFVLASSLLTETLGLDAIGDDITFKAQSFGRTIDGSAPFDVTVEARSLKPYAPTALEAVRDATSGDWELAWVRRTRIGGDWKSGGTIALGETTEAYRVRFFDEDGVEVAQYDTTDPEFTYEAADQTTDFGGTQTALSWSVCQLGDAVEGFQATMAMGFPPEIVAVGTYVSGDPSVTLGLPDDLEAGHTLLAAIQTASSSDPPIAPTGWREVETQTGADLRLSVFEKIAGYGEIDPTFGRASGTGYINGRIVAVSGGLTVGSAVEVDAGGTYTGPSASSPGLTTESNSNLILDFFCMLSSSPVNADLTSLTTVFSSDGSIAGRGVSCHAGVKASAGAVSATTATIGYGSTANAGAIKVAIRPA